MTATYNVRAIICKNHKRPERNVLSKQEACSLVRRLLEGSAVVQPECPSDLSPRISDVGHLGQALRVMLRGLLHIGLPQLKHRFDAFEFRIAGPGARDLGGQVVRF